MGCKEHSYLYLGHSGLMTTQSHLQWNPLSAFQASAMSDGIINVSVLCDNTYLYQRVNLFVTTFKFLNI